MDTDQLRKRARAISLACEEPVAKDISKALDDAAALAKLQLQRGAIPRVCSWEYDNDYDDGWYDTDCGKQFFIDKAMVKVGHYEYCPGCGNKIEEA